MRYMKVKYSFNKETLINFLYSKKIFPNEIIDIILNDNSIINSFLLLDFNRSNNFDYNNLEYNNYVILSFPKSHKSFFLSLNKAKGLSFINVLLDINNKDSYPLRTDIVKEVGEDKYIIIVPEYFYSQISDETLNTFLRILERGYFCEFTINKHIREQIISLINSFGGINEQIFLNYSQYCNKVIE